MTERFSTERTPTERSWRLVRGLVVAALVVLFVAAALWGIRAPFAWGHVGFHGGFHGSAARNLERHGQVVTTPWVGRTTPPPDHARYLHHPIGITPYLAVMRVLSGEKEWGARLVPILFTLATFFVLLWVLGRWWGPWHALFGGALFLFLPHNLVYCHLYDYETPGILFTLLGVVGALEALRARASGSSLIRIRPPKDTHRQGTQREGTQREEVGGPVDLGAPGSAAQGAPVAPAWRWIALAAAGFGLAAITDWTPYFIGLAFSFALFGFLLASEGRAAPGPTAGRAAPSPTAGRATPGPTAGRAAPGPFRPGPAVARVALCLGVVSVLLLAFGPQIPGWPAGRSLAVVGALFLCGVVGAALVSLGRGGGPVASDPANRSGRAVARPGGGFSLARPTLRPWVALGGVALLLVLLGAGHLWLARRTGLGADLATAARVRGEFLGTALVGDLGKYLDGLIHTFTLPVVILGGSWLLALPVRAWLGTLGPRSLLPLVFFAGQWIHNTIFPGEVDVHIYRTYFFNIALATAAVDLGDTLARLVRWALGALALPGARQAMISVVLLGFLSLSLLAAQARAAWPVLVEGRMRSGTLRYTEGYRHELQKVALFRWIGGLAPKDALVLYTYDLLPRMEALYYLDRDHEVIFTVPHSAQAALEAANWTVAFRSQELRRRELLWDSGGGAGRPLWLVVSAISGCAHPEILASLARRHPLSRLGPWWVVDLGTKGPRLKAFSLVPTRPAGVLARFLAGPLPDYRLAALPAPSRGSFDDATWLVGDCRQRLRSRAPMRYTGHMTDTGHMLTPARGSVPPSDSQRRREEPPLRHREEP